jgi:hypothetical protein
MQTKQSKKPRMGVEEIIRQLRLDRVKSGPQFDIRNDADDQNKSIAMVFYLGTILTPHTAIFFPIKACISFINIRHTWVLRNLWPNQSPDLCSGHGNKEKSVRSIVCTITGRAAVTCQSYPILVRASACQTACPGLSNVFQLAMRSRDSCWVWSTEKSGFDSRQGEEIFLFSIAYRLALGPTLPPIQWVTGGYFLGKRVEGQGRVRVMAKSTILGFTLFLSMRHSDMVVRMPLLCLK